MRPLRFVVIGLGGYSLVHLQAIEWLAKQALARLVGLVVLEADQRKQPNLVDSLKSKNVTFYENIDTFLENAADKADVLTVPIGIHLHAPVSIAAMQAGLDVYCEKPIAATVQEVDELISTQKETGRKIVIGFQHIYSHSIQQLKKRICDGTLGSVKSISVIHGWPRSLPYYSRNEWTGRLRSGKNWVLDSPANNAMAHYLFNMLYLSSPILNDSASPVTVRAELYRANRIEGADLTQIKFTTNANTEGFAIFTHSNIKDYGPVMKINCKNGCAYWQTDEGQTLIKYSNGSTEELNNLAHAHWRFEGIKNLIEAIRNNSHPICTPMLARTHTLTINAMHESCAQILTIPDEFIVEEEALETIPRFKKSIFRRVKNLDEDMRISFEKTAFFSELDIPWAKTLKSEVFEIKDYHIFPQHREIS